MNTWLITIILILITGYILECAVSLLNLKALSPDLPEEFRGFYDEHDYAKSQRYTQTTTRLSLISSSCATTVTLLFLLLGGFNSIDLFARGFDFGPIVTGLIFAGTLVVLSFILNLPFSIYSTFKIEEEFGFNRTTPRTFLLDICKATLLTILLGGPLLALILWFFQAAGDLAWLYCWAGTVFFSIALQFLAPVLIMPLFNKFSPLEDGSLKDSVMTYARKENFKLKGIYTMDGSKRSSKLNAFFTGFGRFRKIVFYDTLLEKLDDQETVAVLAHEMGHYKLKHIFKMVIGSILQTGIMFYLLSLILNNSSLFAAFSMDHISIYASLIFFGFLYSPISLLLSILFHTLSRKHEFEADAYAVKTAGAQQSLINGLKKLSQANLSNLTPHPLAVILHYSHPPVLQRIKAIRAVPAAD